jgi:hypothetical protein
MQDKLVKPLAMAVSWCWLIDSMNYGRNPMRGLSVRNSGVIAALSSICLICLAGSSALAQGAATAPSPASQSRPQGLKLPFTLSPETTYITSPLNDDGTPNYVAALNEICSKGVTADNNAAMLIIPALGPACLDEKFRDEILAKLHLPSFDKNGQYIDDMGLQQSFNNAKDATAWALTRPSDDPEMTACFRANEKPLAMLAEASRRPRFYIPWPSAQNPPTLFDGVVTFPMGQLRTAGRILAWRAQVRAQAGDFDAAIEDLMTIHRLARLQWQRSTFIDYLVAISFEGIACNAEKGIIQNLAIPKQQAAKLAKNLQSLPPMPMSHLDAERLLSLDTSMVVARHGFGALVHLYGQMLGQFASPSSKSAVKVKLPDFDMDMDEYLRTYNAVFDSLGKAGQTQTYTQKLAIFGELAQTVPDDVKQANAKCKQAGLPEFADNESQMIERVKVLLEVTGTSDKKRVSRALARFDLSGMDEMGIFQRSTALGLKANALLTLNQVTLALNAFHVDKGVYPGKLEELVPVYLDALPADPASAGPLKYKQIDNRAIVYSVGPNQKDDDGQGEGDINGQQDDIAFEITPSSQAK